MALEAGDPPRLGPFALVDRLGEGGQGVVYLGRGPAGESVAIKLLHARLTADPEARQRFLREAALARRVARFCTAPVLHADLAGDRPYIVSEYVPGPSLQRLVEREGPRRGAALERLAISTATALTAIHRAGITHRDFKPANVLMGPEGPVVIDFGVARALDSPQATVTGGAVGTPSYLAPELLGGGPATPAADMFAWGVTMVFAASGRPAFGADTIPAVIARILNAEPELGSLSGPLKDLVAACLSKDPARRPSAEQVVAALTGGPSPAGVPAGAAPGAGRRRRVPLAAVVGAAIAVAAAGTVTAMSLSGNAVSLSGNAKEARATAAAPAAAGTPAPSPSAARRSRPAPTPSATRRRSPSPPPVHRPTAQASAASPAARRTAARTPAPRTARPTATRPATIRPTTARPTTAPRRTATPKPAPTAKPNPYTPQGVCGAGYTVIDSHSYGGRATTYLLYNPSTGKNCVVTLSKYVVPGKIKMSAVLKVQGGPSAADSGSYTVYAGPLRLAARHTCVIWGGGYGAAAWTSGWSHCA